MMKRILVLTFCLWMSCFALGCTMAREGQPGDGIRDILAAWRTPGETGTRLPVKRPDKIRLLWQNFFNDDINLAKQPPIPGINVISPCWFTIADAAGTVRAIEDKYPDPSYTKQAHEKGYLVWALVTNGDFDPDVTEALLANEAGQRRAIENLLKLAKEYDLDGLNLDFENIYLADRDRLTHFVREIAAAAKGQGLTVSIDVTFPGGSENWSQCYDRRGLAEAVDYVAVMAYDEHSQGSDTAGPVASLDWVEAGLRATLEEVSPEKLLLGMPLYMRLWEEEEGRLVKASTLRMEQAERLWREKKAIRQWLAEDGQYYFSYQENGRRYRVWQEDARSLALKAALVNRYNLAGAAFWRRGHEAAAVWPAVMAVFAAAEGLGAP